MCSLQGCKRSDWSEYTPELNGKVEANFDENYLEYGGKRYDLWRGFYVMGETPEQLSMISWSGGIVHVGDLFTLQMGYINRYTAVTDDDPPFIYFGRGLKLFVSSDFDRNSEMLTVDGYDIEMSFADAFSSASPLRESPGEAEYYLDKITVRFKSYPYMELNTQPVRIGDKWYFDYYESYYELSDGFVSALALRADRDGLPPPNEI